MESEGIDFSPATAITFIEFYQPSQSCLRYDFNINLLLLLLVHHMHFNLKGKLLR